MTDLASLDFAQLETATVARFLETIQQLEALIGAEPAAGDRASNTHLQQLLLALRKLFVAPPPIALASSAASAAQPVEGWTYDEYEGVYLLHVGSFLLNVFALAGQAHAFYWAISVSDNKILAMNTRTPTIGLAQAKLAAERALVSELHNAASILGFTLTKATP